MLRKTSAVLVGILVALFAGVLVYHLGHTAIPTSTALGDMDGRAIFAYFDQAALQLQVVKLSAWAFGSFVGAAVASWIARTSSLVPGLMVGVAVLVTTGFGLFSLPNPLWMKIAGVVLPMPAAWLGTRIS